LSNGLQQLSQEISFHAVKACNNFLKSYNSKKQPSVDKQRQGRGFKVNNGKSMMWQLLGG
jgi:hypothetical protein